MKSKKILIVEDEFVVANDIALILKKTGYKVMEIADSVPEALQVIEKDTPDMVLLDIRLKGKLTGIDLAHRLKESLIPFIYLSANSNKSVLEEAKKTNPYGFLVKPFREKDILVSLEIASYHHEHSLEYQSIQQKDLSNKLNTSSQEFNTREELLLNFVKAFQSTIPFDFCEIQVVTSENDPLATLGFYRIAYNEYQTIDNGAISTISGISKHDLDQFNSIESMPQGASIFNIEEIGGSTNGMSRIIIKSFKMKCVILLPLILTNQAHFIFSFFSRQPGTYTLDHIELWKKSEVLIKKRLSRIYDLPFFSKNKTVAQPITTLSSKKTFEGIVGSSPALLKTFDQIKRVAPMETTVLIIGESGTGKELIAKALHKLSSRKDQPLVTINCATLPENLVESILFGHEKGSFTGATERKTGKFEQAQGGTIFLDEIGEMPIDIQVKLLRVLQEREIEKVGSSSPIKINVRVIAATNRNLEEEVAAGNFRLDLYYRLNIFPIVSPPLRDRKEDIPLLINHFLTKLSLKGKDIQINEEVMNALVNYEWPGNIRELEHYMERSLLLANSTRIDQIHYPITQTPEDKKTGNRPKTISEIEREHILNILRKCGGKVFGKGGAAEMLDIPPSTLNSKIKKLGIAKNEIYSISGY